jgi:hypothetical protein
MVYSGQIRPIIGGDGPYHAVQRLVYYGQKW